MLDNPGRGSTVHRTHLLRRSYREDRMVKNEALVTGRAISCSDDHGSPSHP